MASPPDAPRPPSVERLLAVVRPRLAAPAQASKGPAHRSNVAAAREILADERPASSGANRAATWRRWPPT